MHKGTIHESMINMNKPQISTTSGEAIATNVTKVEECEGLHQSGYQGLINLGSAENTLAKIIFILQNFNVEKPKFTGITGGHPVTFIEALKGYVNKVPVDGKSVEVIMECLTGETRKWTRVYIDRRGCFDDFQKDFMN